MTDARIPLVRVQLLRGDAPPLAASSTLAPSPTSSAELWQWADAAVRALRDRGDPPRVLTCQLDWADGTTQRHAYDLDGVRGPASTRAPWEAYAYAWGWPLSLHVQHAAYATEATEAMDARRYDLGPAHPHALAPVRVRAALRHTPAAYLEQCLRSRVPGPHATGSVFLPANTEAELLQRLRDADWKPYAHPAVLPCCTAFHAPLPGLTGLVALGTLDRARRIVTLADPKRTGELAAHVDPEVAGSRPWVGFSVLLVGPNEAAPDQPEMVWTFHPGEPVRPSTVQAPPGTRPEVVTVGEALDRGFVFAKVARMP